MLLLGELDVNVACIFDLVPQALEDGIQTGRAHRRRPHVHAAPLLPQIERDTEYANLQHLALVEAMGPLPTFISHRLRLAASDAQSPNSHSKGWRHRSPGKRAYSRSAVIHSLPDSIARAAK